MTAISRTILPMALVLFSFSATAALAKSIKTTFDAPYAATVNAAVAALKDLNLRHKGTKAGDGKTIVSFARPVTAFSWGEKGSITIAVISSDKTQVTVKSRKNLPVQITGKTTKTFSQQIFSAMSDHLE